MNNEKQIGLRLKDPALEVLNRRVKQLNELAPENSTSQGTIVKYAVEDYARRLDRKEIETSLSFLYIDKYLMQYKTNDEYAAEHPYVEKEELQHSYSFDELEILSQAFTAITEIVERHQNIEERSIKAWRNISNVLTHEFKQYKNALDEYDYNLKYDSEKNDD